MPPSPVEVRFYEELNNFLPPERRKTAFSHALRDPTSVKDLIEGLGVPHTEVELIVVDGRSVGFDHIVRGGERIAVYPLFESIDVSDAVRLRPEPMRALRPPRFVVDVHLGKLARYLRLAGFDTTWRNDLEDRELSEISAAERRILLTRDRRLLQRKIVTHGIFVRADDPRAQFRQVADRLDLDALARPLTRCTRCNGELGPVDKAEVDDQLEPKTRLYYDEFRRCASCGQVYWRGTHAGGIERLLAGLIDAPDRAAGGGSQPV